MDGTTIIAEFISQYNFYVRVSARLNQIDHYKQILKYHSDLICEATRLYQANQPLDDQMHCCPECMAIVPQEELDMFGGLCEECNQKGYDLF